MQAEVDRWACSGAGHKAGRSTWTVQGKLMASSRHIASGWSRPLRWVSRSSCTHSPTCRPLNPASRPQPMPSQLGFSGRLSAGCDAHAFFSFSLHLRMPTAVWGLARPFSLRSSRGDAGLCKVFKTALSNFRYLHKCKPCHCGSFLSAHCTLPCSPCC